MKTLYTITVLISFFSGICLGVLVIRLCAVTNFGIDLNTGVQKAHISPTSRLGGLAVLIPVFIGLIYGDHNLNLFGHSFIYLFLCSIPVFISGIIEDITHKITAYYRLLFSILSAFLAYIFCDVNVYKTDVFFIDFFLQLRIFVFVISIIVIAGFTNAINLIDGFHGLALSQVILINTFIGILAFDAQQNNICFACSILVASSLALFILNWPLGLIFLGDGGAYFLGFMTVCLGLVLLDSVKSISPLAIILIGIYPLIDTTFSIYRRKIIRGTNITIADRLHMHSLIYRRIKRKYKNSSRINIQKKDQYFFNINHNAKVSIYIFCFSVPFDLIAYFNKSNIFLLSFIVLLYVLLYLYLFNSLCRFKRT